MRKDSGVDLKHLKVCYTHVSRAFVLCIDAFSPCCQVDGGMTEGDVVMQVLSDLGGFEVVRPEMRECVLVISDHNDLLLTTRIH